MEQRLELGAPRIVLEDECGEFPPIHRAVAGDDIGPETPAHGGDPRAASGEKHVDDPVGVDDRDVELAEHPRHGRLAGRDPAGQSDRQDRAPRVALGDDAHGSRPALRRAPSRVLSRSIATVSGPTPPGTGVIALARSAASPKWTSPTSALPFFWKRAQRFG